MPGGIHPPIEVVLSWPEPNYNNPPTRPKTVVILACVLGPITTTMLFARLWVRIIIQRHPGCDDWTMLAATIPTIALTVIYPYTVEMGFNKHIWDLNPVGLSGRMVSARKYILAAECVFCVASGLIKISILLFYRRLSSRAVSTTFRRVTWFCIGFIITYTIALTLAPILGCQPISAFWDQLNVAKLTRGYKFRCFDEGADVFAASVISSAQDLLTAILPTFLYWNIRITIRQKIALLGIFAIGYAGVAIGAVRAYYSWRVFYDTYDVTWWTWDLMLTCLLELHIGAFCANAPALKVFFKHFFHDKLNSNSCTRTPETLGSRKHSLLTNLCSNTPLSSFFSNLSTLLSKGSLSRSTNGYIPEPHNSVFFYTHGGVQVQRDFQVTRSPLSTTHQNRHESVTTTQLAYDPYYEDIELGRYTTGHNSWASSMRSTRVIEGDDLNALPLFSRSPMSMESIFTYNAHPQSSIMEPLPQIPPPALIASSKDMSRDINETQPSDWSHDVAKP